MNNSELSMIYLVYMQACQTVTHKLVSISVEQDALILNCAYIKLT